MLYTDLAIAPFTPACSEGGRKIRVLNRSDTRINRSNPSTCAGYGCAPLLAAGTSVLVFLPSTLHVCVNDVEARFALQTLSFRSSWNRHFTSKQRLEYQFIGLLVSRTLFDSICLVYWRNMKTR